MPAMCRSGSGDVKITFLLIGRVDTLAPLHWRAFSALGYLQELWAWRDCTCFQRALALQ